MTDPTATMTPVPPTADRCSCPRCGGQQLIPRIVTDSIITLDAPHPCGLCGKPSPLSEWLERRIGSWTRPGGPR